MITDAPINQLIIALIYVLINAPNYYFTQLIIAPIYVQIDALNYYFAGICRPVFRFPPKQEHRETVSSV